MLAATTAPSAKREAVKTFGFIVLRGGRPCRIFNAACTLRGGVLLPGKPVQTFNRMRDARRAINRTKRVAHLLEGSLIEKLPSVAALLADIEAAETFSILPLTR